MTKPPIYDGTNEDECEHYDNVIMDKADAPPFKHGEPYWTIEGEGTDAHLVEHTYSDDIGLDGMAEQDGYEQRYYTAHRHAFLALQRIRNTP